MVQTLGLLPDARRLAASRVSLVQILVFALVAWFVAPLVFYSTQALVLTYLTGVLLGMTSGILSDNRLTRLGHVAPSRGEA